ncbi:uncharacterized protein LOC127843118 [Dreissena polymorpha]|uniref:Uncharacterized protein n=1 Tax=Dreissena polymorpha TaxID=45954 RepID=A0A9D4ESV2_DREPO|nr:uncharacterized protein LOC127843118 [Dreissena polymorpha]KAH3785018.1 hypothetical protein DPMN_163101 [Dreissena polymorpha]
MHNTLSSILAITVLIVQSDANCDPTSFYSLPRAILPPAWRSQPIEIINMNNTAYLCRNFDCRFVTHEALAKRLPGSFFKITEYSMESGLRYVSQRPILKRSSNDTAGPCSLGIESDGDYCCPTTRYFTCFTTSQAIININTQSCLVFALSNMFQCVTSSACCGGGMCSGNGLSCRLEDSMQSLFAWNVVSNQLKFEMFQFPASCTCKSN